MLGPKDPVEQKHNEPQSSVCVHQDEIRKRDSRGQFIVVQKMREEKGGYQQPDKDEAFKGQNPRSFDGDEVIIDRILARSRVNRTRD